MKPADLRGRRVALLGLGIDVEAAIPAILEAEPGELFVLEEWTAAARDDLGPRFTAFTNLPEIDVAVRSPGFPLHRADVQERVRRGLETVTPLGLWLSERGGARPTIAITGTKGKSTTSLLTATALAQLEIVAHVLGNIGVPPWTVAPDTTDTVVLEISSFQAADLPCAAPYSALTSIGDDHADWHGSTLQYLADKARRLPRTDLRSRTVVRRARRRRPARTVHRGRVPEDQRARGYRASAKRKARGRDGIDRRGPVRRSRGRQPHGGTPRPVPRTARPIPSDRERR